MEFAAFASSLTLILILFEATNFKFCVWSIGAKGMPFVQTLGPDFQAGITKSYTDNVVPKKGGLNLNSFEWSTRREVEIRYSL